MNYFFAYFIDFKCRNADCFGCVFVSPIQSAAAPPFCEAAPPSHQSTNSPPVT